MNSRHLTRLSAIIISVTVFFFSGCEKPSGKTDLGVPGPEINLGTTIGSLVEVFSMQSIGVEGYALVDRLNGTGSSECPPAIRTYLTQYILKHLQGYDVDEYINSSNTAVVRVEGRMPTTTSAKQYFDVRVSALAGTQTTSIEGGWLYRAELKAAGNFGTMVKTLATVEGPIYIDRLAGSPEDQRSGYILAGGQVLDTYKINLVLRRPDYQTASLIRNKLNERFGSGTAKAISSDHIELVVPPEYAEQRRRFTSIVKSIYTSETKDLRNKRISTFIRKLAVSSEKEQSEIMLEAIGNASLSKLSALLNSSGEEIRLRAGRCMLNLGSDAGLEALREIATDSSSAYRIEALEAITSAANRNDATAISRNLLRGGDFDIRLAAYEQLRRLEDIAIRQRSIARSFYLEEIVQSQNKSIFVSRSGQPRIVLFGVPIYCRENVFIQSSDGSITINAPAGQEYVSIIRKHPRRPNVMAKLESSFEMSDIIRTLCEEPVKREEGGHVGLNVSYSEAIALLQRMVEKGAVDAEFRAGPMPKIGPIIKK
ncbi:MAG: flagellar basal body P-ring protein FlgI [Sedimentisphaerales bacterium]|nr:flagellar basal body P-ring protein FlgI [Sedimentisphaerales bacterium]